MANDKARSGAETAGDKKGILLESGTNEFEIVEFSIGSVHYGINVAKVREVIQRTPVTAMPQAHPYIDGLFTLRGKAIFRAVLMLQAAKRQKMLSLPR